MSVLHSLSYTNTIIHIHTKQGQGKQQDNESEMGLLWKIQEQTNACQVLVFIFYYVAKKKMISMYDKLISCKPLEVLALTPW